MSVWGFVMRGIWIYYAVFLLVLIAGFAWDKSTTASSVLSGALIVVGGVGFTLGVVAEWICNEVADVADLLAKDRPRRHRNDDDRDD